jgi:hypothetical protein
MGHGPRAASGFCRDTMHRPKASLRGARHANRSLASFSRHVLDESSFVQCITYRSRRTAKISLACPFSNPVPQRKCESDRPVPLGTVWSEWCEASSIQPCMQDKFEPTSDPTIQVLSQRCESFEKAESGETPCWFGLLLPVTVSAASLLAQARRIASQERAPDALDKPRSVSELIKAPSTTEFYAPHVS